VLREVKNAGFGRRLTLLGWRYFPVLGAEPGPVSWRRGRFGALRAAQAERPVVLFGEEHRTYWVFEDRVFWEDEDLAADDVLALVRERQRRRRRTLERAHAALAGEASASRRQPIPHAVRLAVWERDGGRCVECGSRFDIQYDHVIPVVAGGATSVENLQILCAPCNRRKGAAVG
jgi:5-methylcytosine-specific restriction endonuclease McrA